MGAEGAVRRLRLINIIPAGGGGGGGGGGPASLLGGCGPREGGAGTGRSLKDGLSLYEGIGGRSGATGLESNAGRSGGGGAD